MQDMKVKRTMNIFLIIIILHIQNHKIMKSRKLENLNRIFLRRKICRLMKKPIHIRVQINKNLNSSIRQNKKNRSGYISEKKVYECNNCLGVLLQ